ncbi:hypothetical protein [Inquilinus limosus]|uniref:ATP-dependent DNA ligase n=1 Tax=Inquilinus limosus TaxID=171674 RepID=UPI001FDF0536|nr:hypothetical protein [Inquilinus limosus]
MTTLTPTAFSGRMPGIDVPLSLEPMEAESVSELPEGRRWQYEPKWDGFRCIAFKDGGRVELQSRNQKPLGRYFPELVEALGDLPVDRFVLDGEILAFVNGEPTFEALQLRLHPAASRVAKLAAEQPATFMAFDLLATDDGKSVISRPLRERRALLEARASFMTMSASATCSRSRRRRASSSCPTPAAAGGAAVRRRRPHAHGQHDRDDRRRSSRTRSALHPRNDEQRHACDG